MSWFKTCDSKQKTEKEQKDEKLVFKKIAEIVENADLHKPVLNTIMTTKEQCIKQNFVNPLSVLYAN